MSNRTQFKLNYLRDIIYSDIMLTFWWTISDIDFIYFYHFELDHGVMMTPKRCLVLSFNNNCKTLILTMYGIFFFFFFEIVWWPPIFFLDILSCTEHMRSSKGKHCP